MNIIIGAKSFIIALGINTILNRLNRLLKIRIATTKEQFEYLQKHFNADFLIITSDFYHNIKHFNIDKLIVIRNNETKLENYTEIIDINTSQKHLIDILSKYIKNTENQKEGTPLTEREKEILKLIVLGYKSKEIADRLFISEHTVNTHRKNITQKLGIKTLSGLTVYAIFNGLVKIENI